MQPDTSKPSARPSVRKDQKEATKRKLIETASRLFAKEGIAATATANVAKALKLSHGTVFVHFPKREDLILAVIDDFANRLASELREALSEEQSLEKVLKAHVKTLAAFEDFYFRLLSELQALPEPVRSTVFMLNSVVSWRMYEVGAPLMRAGKIKRIDRPKFFNSWMALLHYYIVNRDQLSEKRPILTEQGDGLVKHFLNLVQG
jgi:AcrR family transcriptional regulator